MGNVFDLGAELEKIAEQERDRRDCGDAPALQREHSPNTPALEPQKQGKGSEKKYRWSDLGNAERLVAAHGKDLKYCHPFGKWLVWDGKRWGNDHTGAIKRKCKSVIRQMYYEASRICGDERRKAYVD